MAIKGLASITSPISKPLKDSGSLGLGSGTRCPITLQGYWKNPRIPVTSEMHFVLCVHDQLHLRQRTLMGHSLRQQGQTKTDKGKKRNATEICLFTVIEVFFLPGTFSFRRDRPLFQNGFPLYRALGEFVTGMSSRLPGLSNQGFKIAITISASMKGRPLLLLAFKRKHPRWLKQTGTLCI